MTLGRYDALVLVIALSMTGLVSLMLSVATWAHRSGRRRTGPDDTATWKVGDDLVPAAFLTVLVVVTLLLLWEIGGDSDALLRDSDAAWHARPLRIVLWSAGALLAGGILAYALGAWQGKRPLMSKVSVVWGLAIHGRNQVRHRDKNPSLESWVSFKDRDDGREFVGLLGVFDRAAEFGPDHQFNVIEPVITHLDGRVEFTQGDWVFALKEVKDLRILYAPESRSLPDED